jgi:hypothetical protein
VDAYKLSMCDDWIAFSFSRIYEGAQRTCNLVQNRSSACASKELSAGSELRKAPGIPLSNGGSGADRLQSWMLPSPTAC